MKTMSRYWQCSIVTSILMLSTLSVIPSYGQSVIDSLKNCENGNYEHAYGMGSFVMSVTKKESDKCFLSIHVDIEQGESVFHCVFSLSDMNETQSLYQSNEDILGKLQHDQNCNLFASWAQWHEQPPIKYQLSTGVLPDKITCSTGFVLMLKVSDSSPACMKSETAKKLVERGWGVLNEQTVWFEYTGIECKPTPWENYLPKMYANMSTVIYLSEVDKIQSYFKEQQEITIIQSLWTNYLNTHPPPLCGQSADFSYYFLVPQVDANKMTTLGYKQVYNVPSSVHAIGKL